MTRPALLIDGNNLLIRAVEATKNAHMHGPSGINTGALTAVINSLSRYMRETKPYRAVVLWDSSTPLIPTWRKVHYPQYKATRPTVPDEYRSQSRTLVTRFLDLARFPQVAVPGEEADDLIASYWRTLDTPVTILSGDKDLLQLVGVTPNGHPCDQIRLTNSGTTDWWNAERVEEHFGCTPEQMPIAMSLAGDTADNIPGVKGFAMKTAVKHLKAAGWDPDAVTHENVVASRAAIRLYRNLVDLRDADYARASPPLPQITPFTPTTVGPDQAWRDLYAFLAEHGMNRAITRLIAKELW